MAADSGEKTTFPLSHSAQDRGARQEGIGTFLHECFRIGRYSYSRNSIQSYSQHTYFVQTETGYITTQSPNLLNFTVYAGRYQSTKHGHWTSCLPIP